MHGGESAHALFFVYSVISCRTERSHFAISLGFI